jgi:hypothetical protein
MAIRKSILLPSWTCEDAPRKCAYEPGLRIRFWVVVALEIRAMNVFTDHVFFRLFYVRFVRVFEACFRGSLELHVTCVDEWHGALERS